MAQDQEERQKEIARKREERRKRRAEKKRAWAASYRSPQAFIRNAREFPVRECLCADSLDGSGLGAMVIARDLPGRRVAFAVYLVDRFCLGVKNAFCNVVSRSKYKSDLKERLLAGDPASPIAVEPFHQIVYGAVDYARQYGFEPHKDFELAGCLLDPRDQVPPGAPIEFGKDGRPFYVSGPHDDVEQIVRTLDETAGPGNYDFLRHLVR
ncbi:MAG: hypothetical protein ACOC8E_04835 [Planctomycetota bacterium]